VDGSNDTTTLYLACLFLGAAVAVAVAFDRHYLAAGFAFLESDLSEKLRRLRSPTTHLRALLIVWLVVLAASFVGFAWILGNIVFALLVPAFLLCAPWYLIRRMAERRRQKIEDQLADSMVTLANAVRAGLSLAQSMEILAAQCPKPINAEFHQMVAEYKMGKPMDRTLREAKERLQSENFALFAAAMLASHESGGRLNETVERIAQSVLEMQRLERKIKAETAQARKSAIYMAIAPAVLLVADFFIDPYHTTMMFTTLPGQVMLGIALVFNVAAYFWARWILNPDI